jgi:VRR-NUC domain
MRSDEHLHQVALFHWAAVMSCRHPALLMMFAIPNGGLRSKAVAGKLKAEGVRSGVPDLFLPWVTSSKCGLFIEMKSSKGIISPAQKWWADNLTAAGYYRHEFCYSWTEAARVICNYLGIDAKAAGVGERD